MSNLLVEYCTIVIRSLKCLLHISMRFFFPSALLLLMFGEYEVFQCLFVVPSFILLILFYVYFLTPDAYF
jgi:hypothetical protein